MLLLCNKNNYFPRIKPLKYRIIIPYLLLHPPRELSFIVSRLPSVSFNMWPILVPLLLLLLLFLGFFDWYYHCNSIFTIFSGLCRKQRHLSDTFSVHRVSSVFNTDTTFAHVNNAKYLMYMDFAREDFWCRTKLSSFLWRVRAIPLQSASIIRYMIPIPIFTPIRVDTKVRVSQLLGGEWREEKLYLLLVGLVGRKDALLGAQVRD